MRVSGESEPTDGRAHDERRVHHDQSDSRLFQQSVSFPLRNLSEKQRRIRMATTFNRKGVGERTVLEYGYGAFCRVELSFQSSSV
jgi:hypothetical protein